MFRNMVKRAWLSIIRKPGRAVIIGLILFAMANLVLASMAIKGAVAESTEYAKSSLGGTVYLQADIEKLREQQSQGMEEGVAPTPGQRPQIDRPDISVSMVEQIAESEYVKDYTYSISTQAKASGFSPLEESTSAMPGGDGPRGSGFAEESSDTELEADITVQGINSYAYISAVQNETMKLTGGDYFDESSENQAIISQDLATSNSLNVGDTILLQNVFDSTSREIKIIGIYDMTEEQAFGSSANMIYMNIATAAEFLNEDDYSDGDFSVQSVQFILTNAEYADTFISETKQALPEIESNNLALSIDTSAYDQMVGPIESVGAFATTIFWIVVLASAAIITLIVTINVKERRYEMGVLLSLGASKVTVAAQILLELVIVGTAAFILSIGTGTLVARVMSQGLLDNQTSMSQQQSQNNYGRPGTMTGGGGPSGGGRMPGGQTQQSDVEAIDSIDINASTGDYALLFLIGYSVILVALAIPTWNIMKYQPKTILAGKE